MNLYQINADYENIQNEIIDYSMANDGDISQELLDRETEILASLGDKVENVGLYIKNKLAFADALKTEKKALDARIRQITSNIEVNKKYLEHHLAGDKFESTKLKVSYRKSSSIEIEDEELISEDYLKVVTSTSIDKMAIKKAIKSGVDVAGAKEITKQNMQIK